MTADARALALLGERPTRRFSESPRMAVARETLHIADDEWLSLQKAAGK